MKSKQSVAAATDHRARQSAANLSPASAQKTLFKCQLYHFAEAEAIRHELRRFPTVFTKEEHRIKNLEAKMHDRFGHAITPFVRSPLP